jgi:hypothetical protein
LIKKCIKETKFDIKSNERGHASVIAPALVLIAGGLIVIPSLVLIVVPALVLVLFIPLSVGIVPSRIS